MKLGQVLSKICFMKPPHQVALKSSNLNPSEGYIYRQIELTWRQFTATHKLNFVAATKRKCEILDKEFLDLVLGIIIELKKIEILALSLFISSYILGDRSSQS